MRTYSAELVAIDVVSIIVTTEPSFLLLALLAHQYLCPCIRPSLVLTEAQIPAGGAWLEAPLSSCTAIVVE